MIPLRETVFLPYFHPQNPPLKFKFLSSFWFQSVFFTLLNRFSLIVFGVIGYILLAKKVFPTATEMGIWSLFLSILTVVEVIKQGLLRNPMIKFLSESEYVNQRNKVQSVSLFWNICFSLLIILLIIFGGRAFSGLLHAPDLYAMCLWGICFILLLIPFNHYEVLLQAHFRFRQIFYGYFFRQGLFLLGVIVLLLFSKNSLTLVNLVKLQIISLLSGSFVLFFFARVYFYSGFDIDKITMRRMFHFGKYIFGTNVASNLGRYADQFITANLISAEVVAYYNVVSRINNMMDVPSMAVADVLFPKNVEAMSQSGTEKVRYYYERMVGTIISILAPVSIVIFLFPRLFIKILAGSKYMAAVPLLEIVILFSFMRPFNYQFGATMDAIGKPKLNFWVNLLYMALNYGLMYLGLRYLGWMGAAYGSVLATTLALIVIYLVLNKTIGVRLNETFGYVLHAYRDMLNLFNKLLSKT